MFVVPYFTVLLGVVEAPDRPTKAEDYPNTQLEDLGEGKGHRASLM